MSGKTLYKNTSYLLKTIIGTNMNKLLNFLLFTIFFITTIYNYTYAQWEGWNFRRAINIENPNNSVLTNYQIKIELNSVNFNFEDASIDGSDLRVTESDGISEIPFWIEEWNSNLNESTIWVKIPFIPVSGTTIYIYYGNSSAISVSDGESTFDFFDDFANGSYTPGIWGSDFVEHDWKYSSEMLNGVIEYQLRNLIYNLGFESLDNEIELEINYIHSQINQNDGTIINDPGGALNSEPQYCYGLILSNLANGYLYFTHIGNIELAERCYDDMILVYDYLAVTYPNIDNLVDGSGYSWLLFGFSHAWRILNNFDQDRASQCSTIVSNYSNTFLNNQNSNGSWVGATGVQEHLKRNFGLLWAHEVNTNFDYLTAVRDNMEYILTTFWNNSNGGLEWYANASSSDRFFECHQMWFMIAARRLNGRSGGVYNYTSQGYQAWQFLTDNNWAGVDMYVDNYLKNNSFFSYRDVREGGTLQNVDNWKGSYEIGTSLWGMILNYDWVENYQSSHSGHPYNYLDMMVKQIKKTPSNGGFFSAVSGNWVRRISWNSPQWIPDATKWVTVGNPMVSTLQDDGNSVVSFLGNGTHDNYIKSVQNFDNFILEMKVKMTVDQNNNCTPEIGFRVSDNNNRYITMLRGEGLIGGGGPNGDLFIRRYEAGTQTNPTPYPSYNYDSNYYYNYKISANNTTITQFLDNTIIRLWNDEGSNISSGSFSITNYGGSSSNPVYYDDLRVRKYAAIEPTTIVGVEEANPLPVELASFTANIIGANVKLNWITETEIQNYGFEVQRKSGDDKLEMDKFISVGFVQGSGNSNSSKYYSFEDKNLAPGKYLYRLKQIDTDGRFEYSEVIRLDFDKPLSYELSQNYPNPFNPITIIRFMIPEASFVKLIVYNAIGEQIVVLVDEHMEKGFHEINFDASELNSGMYLYRMKSGSFVQTRKMLLVK